MNWTVQYAEYYLYRGISRTNAYEFMQQSGLPRTSARLCFIFVVSVSFGALLLATTIVPASETTFLSVTFVSQMTPYNVAQRFKNTTCGLYSLAVNLSHTLFRSENPVFCAANACLDRDVMQLRQAKLGEGGRHVEGETWRKPSMRPSR